MLSNLVIFALCIVAGAFAITTDFEMENELFNNCLVEHGIAADADLDKVNAEKEPHFAACFYKSKKIMRPDGTIDLERIKSISNEEFDKENFAKIYEICKDKIDNEFMACLMQNLPDEPFELIGPLEYDELEPTAEPILD